MKQALFLENDFAKYTFIRIPKAILSPAYKDISVSGKFLYGLFLERLGLSLKNEWKDARGTYIYYTLKEIAETIGCSKDKAARLLNELENAQLIARVRTGLCKPSKIYIYKPKKDKASDKIKNKRSESAEKTAEKEPEYGTDCVPENKTRRTLKSDLRNTENQTSEGLKIGLPEYGKADSNNTDSNNTEWSNTEEINTDNNKLSNTELCAEAINPSIILQRSESEENNDGFDRWNLKYQSILCNIKRQIDYAALIGSNDKGVIDNIVNIIAEVMLLNKPYYEIGGEKIPSSLVKIRFGQITYQRLEAFLIDFDKICYRIKNPKAYLIAALYNLSMTAGASLANRINYDMANLDFDKAVKNAKERCGIRKEEEEDIYAGLMYV